MSKVFSSKTAYMLKTFKLLSMPSLKQTYCHIFVKVTVNTLLQQFKNSVFSVFIFHLCVLVGPQFSQTVDCWYHPKAWPEQLLSLLWRYWDKVQLSASLSRRDPHRHEVLTDRLCELLPSSLRPAVSMNHCQTSSCSSEHNQADCTTEQIITKVHHQTQTSWVLNTFMNLSHSSVSHTLTLLCTLSLLSSNFCWIFSSRK